MVFAYIRVSTDLQTNENQRLEIERWAKKRDLDVREWVEETISSRQPLRKRKINALINAMREGDILIISELSRMARALFELMELLQKAMQRGVKIMSIKEGYELGDNITSKVMAFAFGLAAEIERTMISDRTKAGLARVKANGVILGRPKGRQSGEDKCKLSGKENEIIKLLQQNVSVSAIGRITGVHRLTVTAFIKSRKLEEKLAKKIEKEKSEEDLSTFTSKFNYA
jgi:DNA invertase Pin-like site-specific DNA recombinase